MSSKVAIYCRLSEEDRDKANPEDDSRSIKNQKYMLVQYAFSQNWEVYAIYSDDNFSGSDRKRPQFNKMLVDAKAKKFDIILCKTQSRFTRELEMVEKYINYLFPIWGIRFVSIVDNADTDVESNKKSRQINGMVNEWFLEDQSKSIKSVFEHKRKEGYFYGSFAPYGYEKDPNQKGHLIIDEEAAEVVRDIFNLYISGMGRTAIARRLNEEGVPNPTEYKRLKGLRYTNSHDENSKLWKDYSVTNIVTSPVYIGSIVQGKQYSVSYKSDITRTRPKEEWTIVENMHEPILTRGVWEQAQAIKISRARPYYKTDPSRPFKANIFSKKCFCINCMKPMTTKKSHGDHYLTCSSRKHLISSCKGAFISEKLLHNTVLAKVKELINTYINLPELERGIVLKNNFAEKRKRLEEKNTQHKKKIEDIKNSSMCLYGDKVKGVISEQQFVEFNSSYQAEREQLEKNITVTNAEIDMLTGKEQTAETKRSVMERYTNADTLTQEMINELIDKVIVGEDSSSPNGKRIEIHWKF